MKIFDSVSDLIGATPLLCLSRYKDKTDIIATILAKLEYFNPAGSAKDRIAKKMIEDAEAMGLLKPGSVIIEPTSGNTGIGLAAVSASKGYKTIFTMPETMSIERQNLLKAYGAEIILTDGKLGMSGAIQKATELAGKTLGIYGLGTIGMSVARVALAFGMSVIAYSRTKKQVEGVRFVDEKDLFRESDFLTFHCPLTEKTAKIINEHTLSLMKPSAFIINTARGGIVDEPVLAKALKERKIAGAALDVMTCEPMAADCPLWGIDNCIITPHVAWASLEARTRLIGKVAENLRAFKDGNPINVVNK